MLWSLVVVAVARLKAQDIRREVVPVLVVTGPR